MKMARIFCALLAGVAALSTIAQGNPVGTLAFVAVLVFALPIRAIKDKIEGSGLSGWKYWAAFIALAFAAIIIAGATTSAEVRARLEENAKEAERNAKEDRIEAQRKAKDNERKIANQKKTALEKFKGEIIANAKPCDSAFAVVDPAMKVAANGGGMFDLYEAGKMLERTCQATSREVAGIDIPDGLSDENKTRVEEARQDCSTAFYFRGEVGAKIMQVADEGLGPKAVSEVKEASEVYQSRLISCMVNLTLDL